MLPPLKELCFYEFGAGWDLVIPLAFYAFGVENQLLVDIRNLLRVNLINNTIEKFQRMGSNLGIAREPNYFLPSGCSLLSPLSKYYGIQYLAPCDARNTSIDACSIDFITSTNTLEHIPPKDIQIILNECHRLLKDDGVMSFFIDYSDHYAHFDRTITVYNFLQYSEKQWLLFSPTLHYQNRLRHQDYLNLFQNAGFEMVDERLQEGSADALKTIEQLLPDKRFKSYTTTELAISSAHIILKKMPQERPRYHRASE